MMYKCDCGRDFTTPQGLSNHKNYCGNYKEFLDGNYLAKIDSNGKKVYIHREVMEQKLDRKLKPGEEVHHKDEDKLNNDPDNLELTTRSDHAKHHWTPVDQTKIKRLKGSQIHNSILTESKVKEIKLKLNEGVMQKDLCEFYNVKKDVISDIYLNKTWKHVKI